MINTAMRKKKEGKKWNVNGMNYFEDRIKEYKAQENWRFHIHEEC